MQDEDWEKERILEEKYNGKKTEGFFADVKRLESGEPLAYIIGHVPFLRCTIHLDSRPLIPRTETEFWVEKAISEIQNLRGRTPKILDLCAGSGCIGVAVAKAVPGSHVDFIEIDVIHHPTIRKNIEVNCSRSTDSTQYSTRLEYWVYGGNLFSKIPRDKKYDYILSNPPYIDRTLGRTEQSVTKYEPPEALFAEKNGSALITEIVRQAPKYLENGGKLFLEHEPEQVADIMKLAEENGFLSNTLEDQYGLKRYTQLQLKTL